MKKITSGEILALTTLLNMETTGLAVAKASLAAITDEQLKNLAQSGITAAKARIAGLQQFISDNDIAPIQEVH